VVVEVHAHLLFRDRHAQYKSSPRLVEENEIHFGVKCFREAGGGCPALTGIFSDDLWTHP